MSPVILSADHTLVCHHASPRRNLVAGWGVNGAPLPVIQSDDHTFVGRAELER